MRTFSRGVTKKHSSPKTTYKTAPVLLLDTAILEYFNKKV